MNGIGELRPLTFKDAADVLWPFTQEVVRPTLELVGEAPLDLDAADETDALARRLAKDPQYDLRQAGAAAVRLLYRRLTWALTLCMKDPERLVSRIPRAATREEVLSFLLAAEIAGMKDPESELH
jgi:hypothetical protein